MQSFVLPLLIVAASLLPQLAFASCSSECKEQNKPDKRKQGLIVTEAKVDSLLGVDVANTLFNVTNVVCYNLEYRDSTSQKKTSDYVFNSWVRTGSGNRVSSKLFVVMQHCLLSDTINYIRKSTIMSPFIPMLDFQVRGSNREIVDVLISFTDHTWMVVKDGVELLSYEIESYRDVVRLCIPFIENEELSNYLIQQLNL